MDTLTDKICADINRRANEKLANALLESTLEGGLMGVGSTAVSEFVNPDTEDIDKKRKSLYKTLITSGLLGALGGAVASYKP